MRAHIKYETAVHLVSQLNLPPLSCLMHFCINCLVADFADQWGPVQKKPDFSPYINQFPSHDLCCLKDRSPSKCSATIAWLKSPINGRSACCLILHVLVLWHKAWLGLCGCWLTFSAADRNWKPASQIALGGFWLLWDGAAKRDKAFSLDAELNWVEIELEALLCLMLTPPTRHPAESYCDQ